MQSESAIENRAQGRGRRRARGSEAVDGPVFVDTSGRRARLLRRVGLVIGAGCLGYAAVLGMAFMGWGTSLTPSSLLPFDAGRAGSAPGGGGPGAGRGGAAPTGTPTGLPSGAPTGLPGGAPTGAVTDAAPPAASATASAASASLSAPTSTAGASAAAGAN
ncbi:hypothetical protein ACIBAC_31010 [Streptomyces sp. NPDC051362]|uniref:hypothetical protein n=1 Tax=Streptomyces sp. NPDC051362 TaxID=3365651 RepID=UPI00378A1363